MMKVAILCLLALAAQTALAHSYYRADLAPAKNTTTATGVLEFFTHDGVAYYTLNVTGIQGLSSAKVVFGNASLISETVVTFQLWDEPFAGTGSWDGKFSQEEFSPDYPWTVNGLGANIGLDHIWATVNTNASYANNILLGKVNKISGADIKSQYILSDPSTPGGIM